LKKSGGERETRVVISVEVAKSVKGTTIGGSNTGKAAIRVLSKRY